MEWGATDWSEPVTKKDNDELVLNWDDGPAEDDDLESPPMTMKLDRKDSDKSEEKNGNITKHLTTDKLRLYSYLYEQLKFSRRCCKADGSIGHNGAAAEVRCLPEDFNGRVVNTGHWFRGGRRTASLSAVRLARARS